jgi:peptidoglycan/LPS O-acetylase OafA/YrhL
MAILLVMISHFASPMNANGKVGYMVRRLVDAGWTGVDLFFVLSGFLITGILFEAKSKGYFFRNFYARRTLRIFPLYYGVLLLGLVILPFLFDTAVEPGRQGWLWLYGTNIYTLINGHSFEITNGLHLQFGHFWSLAVEEHFYLIWPLIVWSLGRRSLMVVCGLVMVLALGLRIVLVQHGTSPDILYQVTFLRIDSLAAGGLVALLARGPRMTGQTLWRLGLWSMIVGLIGLAIVWWNVRSLARGYGWTQTLGYSSAAVLFAGAISASVARPMSPMLAPILGNAALRGLGKYGYGLYVFHFLLLYWFNRLVPMPTAPFGWNREFVAGTTLHLAICFAGSFAVAWASYQFYEKQFLKLKQFFGSTALKLPYTRTAEVKELPGI